MDGWPGERWFDIRNVAIRPMLEARMDECAEKGFDGIEYDNVEGYLHPSGFALDEADQIVFNEWLATESHERDLAVGLKNGLEMIDELVDDFDFSVNEQCAQYNECDRLDPFIDLNKAVLHIEYKTKPKKVCPVTADHQLSTVFKRLKLDAKRGTCPT